MFQTICMLSCFSPVQLFVTLWTVASQAPLSMRFPRREQWSEWAAMPSSRAPPNPKIKPASFVSPALASRFFITSTTWEAQDHFFFLPDNFTFKVFIKYRTANFAYLWTSFMYVRFLLGSFKVSSVHRLNARKRLHRFGLVCIRWFPLKKQFS